MASDIRLIVRPRSLIRRIRARYPFSDLSHLSQSIKCSIHVVSQRRDTHVQANGHITPIGVQSRTVTMPVTDFALRQP